jgi:DNA-binding transcriptional LysR family regulator
MQAAMKLTPHILAHLPYLAALAETGSFTSAAAQMNITQAAMSYLHPNANHRTWTALLAQHDLTIDHIQDRMILGNTIALKEAAKEGLGIALLPEFVVREDIKDKKLDVLLSSFTASLASKFFLSKINASQMQTYEELLRRVFKEI